MENHPIPQQISSYQFRLVGDMTLKQFFQVAGGCLVSLVFYASKLHPLIKWPFILFFCLLGVALAFLPFEDRPLETWIISFFKSIYSPTIFKWQKINTQPIFYQDEATSPQTTTATTEEQKKIDEYLKKSSNQGSSILSKLEQKEQEFLQALGNIFSSGEPASGEINIQTQTQPQIKQQLDIPLINPTYIPKNAVVEEIQPIQNTQNTSVENVTQTFQGQDLLAKKQAEFSLDAAPPSPPTVPNTIVGQVIDDKGKIIEGAILEVKDAAGRPARALKSNKLGHFLVVTPLSNGKYEISTEKDNHYFEPISFDATGSIIPPIFVKGKRDVVEKIEETLPENIKQTN
ncbi:PrgI family protein [Patescibacteria group bacterium]|nr:PrgI family protein [Patescibacteria group bacterium]MBU2036556.1 PrgI family protein [Patescibacteria group bacterium]